MHRVLLGLAVAAATSLGLAAPVSAQAFAAASFTGSSNLRALNSGYGVRVHRGAYSRNGFPNWATTKPGPRDRDRNGYGYGYTGGYYDSGDYDANRSFDPDKWNDWWHERPERAFPRWMARNRDCARQWYSGDVLTC